MIREKGGEGGGVLRLTERTSGNRSINSETTTREVGAAYVIAVDRIRNTNVINVISGKFIFDD